MAKKLNKLVARLTALEKRVAELFSGKAPARKKARSKKVKKAAAKARPVKAKKKAAKAAKKPAAKKPVKKAPAVKAPGARKPVKKAAREVRVAPPSVEQLAPSGVPGFVQPLDKV